MFFGFLNIILYLVAFRNNICRIGFIFLVQSTRLLAPVICDAGSERVNFVFRDNRRSMLRRLVETDA